MRSLFIAMNDEVFRNREVAITIIGRLAVLNPAYVMPSLRKSLIQLITELEYTTARCVSCAQLVLKVTLMRRSTENRKRRALAFFVS